MVFYININEKMFKFRSRTTIQMWEFDEEAAIYIYIYAKTQANAKVATLIWH